MGIYTGLIDTVSTWLGGKGSKNTNNPKFQEFAELSTADTEAIKQSVLDKYIKSSETSETFPFGNFDVNSAYSEFVYGAISSSKRQRLRNYRRMADFPEVGLAVDEICDAMLNYDENGHLINIHVRDSRLNDVKVSEIKDRFDEYIDLFDFEHNFYDYAKTLVVESQICWENIISDKNKNSGIIGINLVPNDLYEFLIDPLTLHKKGIFIPKEQGNLDAYSALGQQVHFSDNGQGGQNKKNVSRDGVVDAEYPVTFTDKDGIPMLWDQITYIDSGMYTTNKLIVLPVLEKAKKAYRQLALIEDAIIIYRLVRAPQRLIFNVDTGKLPKPKAEQEVYKMMKRYQTRQFYNPITGSVSSDYDAHSMLESYWFAKPSGSEGTKIDTLQPSASWTELPDLEYFHTKLWKSLKIPYSRFLDPKVVVNKSDSMSYEEYSFAKFVMRIQDRFAVGLLKGFIVHLKLLGLWDQYDLKERDLKVKITPPPSFVQYEQQQVLKLKFDNYDIVTKEHPEISRELAMMEFLGYDEQRIKKNREWRENELQWESHLKKRSANIEATGNPYVGGQA